MYVKGAEMLRITVVAGCAGQKIVVEGKLASPCVSELESAWHDARQTGSGRIVIDLSGMTSIDSRGQTALELMLREGARLTATGAFNKHLVKELIDKAREFVAPQHK